MDQPILSPQPAWLVFLRGFFLGSIGLSLFYSLLLIIVSRDLTHPINQFLLLQPWMSLLILGFGLQMGLYRLLKNGYHFNLQEKTDARFAAGTGTTMSGLAMVACCAHHAVDLLPVLGLSAAAIFLSQYQTQFLIFGLLANLAGILIMLYFLTGKPNPKTAINYLQSRAR